MQTQTTELWSTQGFHTESVSCLLRVSSATAAYLDELQQLELEGDDGADAEPPVAKPPPLVTRRRTLPMMALGQGDQRADNQQPSFSFS